MKSLRSLDTVDNDIFDRFFDHPLRSILLERFPGLEKSPGLRLLAPKVDMYEETDKVVVKAELPGVDKKNINISLNNDILTIKGEIKKEEKVNNEDYHYSERSFGSFARHLSLPAKVEDEKIKANFKDGILEIILPYSKKAKQKEINI